MLCYFYLFKVYMTDLKHIALGYVWAYKVFPQNLLDVFGAIPGQRPITPKWKPGPRYVFPIHRSL